MWLRSRKRKNIEKQFNYFVTKRDLSFVLKENAPTKKTNCFISGSVDGLERITSCVSDEALASLELPPPPPPEDAMEDSEPLKFITRLGGHQPRPLSTCESLCSCSSTYGYVSNVDTIDDMCRDCCSCRSSTVTLLPENEDGES